MQKEMPEVSLQPKEFYMLLRSHIEHEDGLCHQRMTWLISLNAFLFGAYGFSTANLSPDLQIIEKINLARTVFATVGFISSAITITALWAAIRSINRLVDRWLKDHSEHLNNFPQIIGNHTSEWNRGTYFGQTPLFGIPSLFLIAWSIIGSSSSGGLFAIELVSYFAIVILIILSLMTLFYLTDESNGSNLGLRWSKFKIAISASVKPRP